MRLSKKDWLILITVTFLALILRLPHLGAYSLSGDEGASYTFASMGIREVFHLFVNKAIATDAPLHNIFLHFWMKLGDDEFTLRLLSAIFGCLTIPIIFLIGLELADKRVGFISAIFLAVSPFHINCSQFIRYYSLFGFISGLSIYTTLMFIKEERWRKSFMFLATIILINALLLYTQYVSVFLLFAEGVLVGVLFRKDIRIVIRWLVYLGFAILLFVPWIAVVFSQYKRFHADWFVNQYPTPKVIFLEMLQLVTSHQILIAYREAPWRVIIAGIAFFLWYGGFLWTIVARRFSIVSAFCSIIFVIPLLSASIYSLFGLPVVIARAFLFVLYPLFIAVALLVNSAGRISRAFLIVVIFVTTANALKYVYFDMPHIDWRGAVDYISTEISPGEKAVVFTDRSFFIEYYSKKKNLNNIDVATAPFNVSGLYSDISDAKEVWFVLYQPPETFPRDKIFAELGKNYNMVGTKEGWFALQIYRFVKD